MMCFALNIRATVGVDVKKCPWSDWNVFTLHCNSQISVFVCSLLKLENQTIPS